MSRLIKRTGLIAFIICLLVSCREQAVYDVVVVGGCPAGIGAALGASGAGAKVDGKVVGSLLSYPGDNYKELRRKSFAVF